MLNLCVITTKTGLSSFLEAVNYINEELNNIINVEIFYTHLLDENDINYIHNFEQSILNSDIILIDIRTPSSWFIDKLFEVISKSRAKVVLPLVIGSPALLQLLKLNGITGKFITSKLREYDFDTQYLDMSKMWKVMDFIEKSGKFLPIGMFKHFRNWILCIKYWTYHGKENLKNMIYLILRNYFNMNVTYKEPVIEIKPTSIYDSELGFINNVEEYLKVSKCSLEKPIIAILLYSGMHFDQCKIVAESLFKELKNRGVDVLLIIGGGSGRDLIKNLEALERNCILNGKSIIDGIINLQWFRINGGPYGGPSEPTWELMRKLNCPLFNGFIMFMREVSKWERDERGISPIEVVTAIALPEIDGAIEPIPLGGLSDDLSKQTVIIKDRIDRKVGRVINWIKLRRSSNDKKRVAIIIYNYPPGEHNVGSASYLDVLKSLEVLIRYLKEHGYKVSEVSREKLKDLISKYLVNSPQWSTYSDDVIVLNVNEYVDYLNTLPKESVDKVIKVWGNPPGSVNVLNDKIIIPGIMLGNVFIGVQPSRGVHENVDKIYHSKDLPPHHQYLAFYYWINHVFRADVIIHLGTHGTLEFMPGKEVGLSSTCFPDLLISNTPHVYVYHVTNPSEMTIAKRRSYAYVVTHGTPSFMKAELYGDYLELEELLQELEEAKVQDPCRVEILKKLIQEKCLKLNLEYDSIDELHDKLFEIKRAIIPKGLHVLGQLWSDDDIIEYLVFLLRYDREVKSLHRLLLELRKLNYDEVLEKPHIIINGKRASKILEEIEDEVRDIVSKLVKRKLTINDIVKKYPKEVRGELKEVLEFIEDITNRIRSSDELKAILRVLNGEYIQPRVAGDPIRNPEIFPTGSHGYAFDPRLIPSKAAYLRGVKIAEETLRIYKERYGKYPETVSVVLWGFETMGTRGETISQILHYLGVRLVRKYGPWSWNLEVIPLEELKRPRIDVVVTICGIFRDTFPNLITMIDRAVRLVASLNEPLEMNYVRKHYLEMKSTYGEDSIIRIFGPKDGAYNTRLTDMIETSYWKSEDELANTYIEDMMYGYGEHTHAKPLKQVFEKLLGRVDLVTQIRYAHEYEIVDLDHYYEFLGGLKKSVEMLRNSKVDTIWIDTTTERVRYRNVKDAIDHAVRTRLLNPKWINSMLNHGYDGVRELSKRVEYILGLAATVGEVPNWVWNKIAEQYVFNDEIRNRMLKENKWAMYEIIKRIYEAYTRGYWKTESEVISKLKEIASRVEELLEE